MHRFIALVSLVVAAPLVACGDNSGEYDDPGVWVTEYVSGLCEKAHDCRSAYPVSSTRSFESDYGASQPACRNLFATAAEVRSAVTLGRTLYDEDRGERCIHLLNVEYAELSCDEFWADSTEPVECAEAFTGLVAAGAECTIHFECASQRCVLDSPEDTTGVCE